MSVIEYEKENQELLESFLRRTFFRGYRESVMNWDRLEMYIDQTCNLDCRYCYLSTYGEELYPREIRDPRRIIEHGKALVDWLVENEFAPTQIELFSGEPLVNPAFYELVEYINDAYASEKRKPKSIVVPTNYTFLLSTSLTERVEDLLSSLRNVPIYLSASIDGKYCEQNRPFRTHPSKDPRDDAYYDRVFEFNARHRFGFHPMIYANRIQYWKKNFLWFQENFRKHNIPFSNIYLLEVRNPEWHPDQIRAFAKFIRWLIIYTFKTILNGNKAKFLHFLLKGKGYNILSGPFTTMGRGIGCSIQSTLTVRLGDLAIVPCHRTSYQHFVMARFLFDGRKITGIESVNPELFITIYSFSSKNFPYCEQCPARELCSQGCLGAQLEFTGDLFMPIPTVCQLEIAKIHAILSTFKDIGVLWDMYSLVSDVKRDAIIAFMRGVGVDWQLGS